MEEENKNNEENIKVAVANKENNEKETIENINKIRDYLERNGSSRTEDIAKYLELSPARTRAIIAEMDNVEREGGNSNRTYRLIK